MIDADLEGKRLEQIKARKARSKRYHWHGSGGHIP